MGNKKEHKKQFPNHKVYLLLFPATQEISLQWDIDLRSVVETYLRHYRNLYIYVTLSFIIFQINNIAFLTTY